MTAPRKGTATALVTGGTAGIGYFTAAGLARGGFRVVITGRDANRGERAAAQIREAVGRRDVDYLLAEHSTVGGNLALAREVEARLRRLDVLVNNVGGIYNDRLETADGYEATIAMNFVGPYTLTGQLLPLLPDCSGRCVNVVSSAFGMVKGDPLADPHTERDYVAIYAYGRAKLLNLLWTRALAERELGLRVYAVNPGMAWTPSTRRLRPRAVPGWRLIWPIVRFFQRRTSAEDAARVPVQIAAGRDTHVSSGSYVDEKGRPQSIPVGADATLPQRVWECGNMLATAAPTARRR